MSGWRSGRVDGEERRKKLRDRGALCGGWKKRVDRVEGLGYSLSSFRGSVEQKNAWHNEPRCDVSVECITTKERWPSG